MKATVKVRLIPNKTQERLFIKFANAARFVYNYTLNLKNSGYADGEYLNLSDLMREMRLYKYAEGNEWLLEVPEAVQKQAVKDMLMAFSQFYKRGIRVSLSLRRKIEPN